MSNLLTLYSGLPGGLQYAMLSYRHAFHAGNHADVLKHITLTCIVRYLERKEKPFSYIDTHAGAGVYRLDADQARKTGEAESGILTLLARQDIPEAARAYTDLCRQLLDGARRYPGSPEVVRALSRPDDALILMELHPSEIGNLRDNMGGDPRIHIHHRDGYAGLSALCPPEPRRGFALVDPSYETASDYAKTAETLIAAHRKWPVGTLALWYPLVGRRSAETAALKDRFYAADIPGILCAELCVCTSEAAGEAIIAPASVAPAARADTDSADDDGSENAGSGYGMYGSGLIIIQPPWTLAEELAEILPWLATALGKNGEGSWKLDWISEPL